MKDYSLRNDIIKKIHALATSIGEHMTELFENGYDQGYEDGKADTPFADYDKGLLDAWEVARKLVHPRLGGYTEEQKQRIFGEYVSSDSILQNFTAAEAIAKIKAYEDKQKQDAEIKVGDEVQSYDTRYIVVRIRDNGTFEAIGACGTDEGLDLSNFHKTGRYFPQIAEVLAELRGAE